MDRHQLVEICERMPVFPLPRTVLLPGARLPLHVFEPRYRSLVDHCRARDRIMGVATLRPGYEANYQGKPDLWPEVGLGEIVAHQPFPDGRCNIVLQYVGGMTLETELPSEEPFRVIRGALADESEGRGLPSAILSLKVLLGQLGGFSQAAAREARNLMQLDGMELVDALARRLLEEPDEQRAYLGAPLDRRVVQVHDRLAVLFVPRQPVGES